MGAYTDNIKQRMDAISAELAQMSCDRAGGSPNIKQADGGTIVDHVGYRKSLLDELERLQKLLANAAAVEAGGDTGPFEIETEYLP